MEWIILVTGAVGVIYGLYFAVIAIVGNLKKVAPIIPYAKPSKRIAAVIPARNEERVVGLLVKSLMKQRYPRELFDVFVLPNNCTDETEAAARKAGARILRCQSEVHTKGEVLRAAFAKMLPSKQYDGFAILDADNLVDSNFFQACNNALCAGYQVGQSYRDSKNPDDNWVAGCTSAFFWAMNRMFNHARAALGLSASLNGTGILIGAEFLKRNGYETSSLTEDLEFTAQCALAGEKIAWMEDAITYDEQPLKLKDSFIQRKRWAAGTRQCAVKYLPRLLKGSFGNYNCLDIGMLFLGQFVQLISLLSGSLTVWKMATRLFSAPSAGLREAVFALALVVIGCVLVGVVFMLLIGKLEGKLSRIRIKQSLMMGWYLVTWMPANVLGCLLPAPKWTQIPHVSEVAIEECGKEEQTMPFQQKETETL